MICHIIILFSSIFEIFHVFVDLSSFDLHLKKRVLKYLSKKVDLSISPGGFIWCMY